MDEYRPSAILAWRVVRDCSMRFGVGIEEELGRAELPRPAARIPAHADARYPARRADTRSSNPLVRPGVEDVLRSGSPRANRRANRTGRDVHSIYVGTASFDYRVRDDRLGYPVGIREAVIERVTPLTDADTICLRGGVPTTFSYSPPSRPDRTRAF